MLAPPGALLHARPARTQDDTPFRRSDDRYDVVPSAGFRPRPTLSYERKSGVSSSASSQAESTAYEVGRFSARSLPKRWDLRLRDASTEGIDPVTGLNL